MCRGTFPKLRVSYFNFARFNTSPLGILSESLALATFDLPR